MVKNALFEATPWPSFYRQAVCFITFLAVFFTTTPVHAAAPVYDPVFYYHHADHLGSGNLMTDRDGELVQQYTYSPFGREQFKDNTSAFGLSNRFTGQTLDEDTGLYYYNARYYDSELGRFISADTIVQEPENPQTLNRYAYCGNNPLKYTDPSGHDFGITAFVVGVLIAAAVGAAVSATVAAVTGGNIAQAALTGAIAGGMTYAFGIPGAAAAGAINASITGGDIAKGALIGGVTAAVSFGIQALTAGMIEGIASPLWQNIAQFGITTTSGAITGGIGAELSGGDFWQGAAMGASTAAAIFTASVVATSTAESMLNADQRPDLVLDELPTRDSFTEHANGVTIFRTGASATEEWVQTIYTNRPLNGATYNYVDPRPNTDTLPFYYTRGQKAYFKNIFIDKVSRSTPTSGTTAWIGTLSRVSLNGSTITRVNSITYGFSINSAGIIKAVAPAASDASQIARQLSTLKSEHPNYTYKNF